MDDEVNRLRRTGRKTTDKFMPSPYNKKYPVTSKTSTYQPHINSFQQLYLPEY